MAPMKYVDRSPTGTYRISSKAYGFDWARLVRLVVIAAAITAGLVLLWGGS